MGRGKTTALLLVLVCGFMSEGCVSLFTYENEKKEKEALLRAYKAADTVVGNYKKEIATRDARIRELQKLVSTARTRVQAANSAIDQERSALKEQYERMVKELKAEGGGAFTINQATGGIVLENDIFFSSGRAVLKPDAAQALDGLIGKLNDPKFSGARIEVAGHTDSDPITRSKWSDNYQLSAERARAVLNYFIERGVTADRIYLSGHGPTQPRSQDKSENRRVEIVLHDKS